MVTEHLQAINRLKDTSIWYHRRRTMKHVAAFLALVSLILASCAPARAPFSAGALSSEGVPAAPMEVVPSAQAIAATTGAGAECWPPVCSQSAAPLAVCKF